MSLIAATQITAVATAVLAAFAIITAVFAFLAFRKQSAGVATLQQQAKRDIEQRRKAQAAKVFVGLGGIVSDMSDEIRIWNTSEQPIYDLTASWADDTELQRLPHLMPGEVYPFFVAASADADTVPPVVRLDFRDAAGLRWRTTSRGELTELPGPRIE